MEDGGANKRKRHVADNHPPCQLFWTLAWMTLLHQLHSAADLALAQAQEMVQELLRRHAL